jgi:hypothetical protein
LDYNTSFSGITKAMLDQGPAPPLAEVGALGQRKIAGTLFKTPWECLFMSPFIEL